MQLSRWWTLGVGAVIAACGVETSGPALDEVVPTFSQAKTDVCHRTASGSWNLITVADPALPTHIAHGDAEPGYAVPNTDGDTFAPDCSIIPAPPAPDFFTFYIRNNNADGGTIIAPWDSDIVLTENAAGDGYRYATPRGGQKVGYGTSFFDGVVVNTIESVSWTQIDGLTNPITYLNIWVTDGFGNFAIIASENQYVGTNFTTRTEWKVFESAGNACNGTCPALDWLFDDGSVAGRSSQYLTRNGSNATLGSLGDNIVVMSPQSPYPLYVGTGAPRGGYGFNLIWGDTQSNFLGYGTIGGLTVTVAGTTYNASN